MGYEKELMEMQDLGYRDFQSRLMPTVQKEFIIGVRTPPLRKFAKQVYKDPESKRFLKELPHRYYEENNLHAFLIELMRDYDEAVDAINRFLPFVDNWATCDSMSPKVLFRHKGRLIEDIKRWLTAKEEYAVRFGIEQLMNGFLDEDFMPETPNWVAGIHREEYYIRMMQAWYFATGLCKRYEVFLPYLSTTYLDNWVLNKTIQKAVESYRLTEEQKTEIRRFRVV